MKEFAACDSQLYLVQEAKDENGTWCEIEELPTTICGNSFHSVFLKPGQCWEIKARAYQGATKTKLRFRLDPDGEFDEGSPIYSPEFDGEVSESQLRRRPGRAEVRRAIRGKDERVAIETLIKVLKGPEKDADADQVRSAVARLGEFGPAAKEAVSALYAQMKLRQCRLEAAFAVVRIEGAKSEPMKILRGELRKRGRSSRAEEAARFLGEIGPIAAEALPDLVAVLTRRDPEGSAYDLRTEAIRALGRIRSRADVVVPVLIDVVAEGDGYRQHVALEALAEFGAEAKAAVPHIMKVVQSAEGENLAHASYALWKIENKNDAANAKVAIDALRKAARSEDSGTAQSAADRLGEIGAPASESVPELRAALAKFKGPTYARALWRVSGQPEPSRTALTKFLSSEADLHYSRTREAIECLAEMGIDARPAIPVLVELHRRAGLPQRKQIQHAVAKIDRETAERLGR
ncbi:MAG: hypothetical protein U0744_07705 [Gemmataceae bacterium]